MLAAIVMVTTAGHRPVSPTRGEPARRPCGRPAVDQVSANKQSARAEEREWKKQQFSQSSSSCSRSPKTPTQKCKMQDVTQLTRLFSPRILSLLSFSAPSHVGLQSLACSSYRIRLQNELMCTINKSNWGETAEWLRPGSCRVQDVSPHPTLSLSLITLFLDCVFLYACVCFYEKAVFIFLN